MPLYKETVNVLLLATRLHDPREKKPFKLLEKRPRATYEEDSLRSSEQSAAAFKGQDATRLYEHSPYLRNYVRRRPERWMAWDLRCEGVEFRSLDDVCGALQKTLDNCAESKITWFI